MISREMTDMPATRNYPTSDPFKDKTELKIFKGRRKSMLSYVSAIVVSLFIWFQFIRTKLIPHESSIFILICIVTIALLLTAYYQSMEYVIFNDGVGVRNINERMFFSWEEISVIEVSSSVFIQLVFPHILLKNNSELYSVKIRSEKHEEPMDIEIDNGLIKEIKEKATSASLKLSPRRKVLWAESDPQKYWNNL